ncbi:MAG: DUF3047 domain-containing protein [Nitrospirae bacterium]|nr:DUF3047 domain-containing protein [Nitrospirota bacterium]
MARSIAEAAAIWSLIIVLIFSASVEAYDVPSPVLGFDGVIEQSGIPRTWVLRTRAGRADAAVVHESEGQVLHIKCRESSFSLEREIMIAPDDFRFVSWTWKAVRLPQLGDVRRKERDDQALQLLVAFDNGRVLSYVWDSNAPEGTVVDESIGWPVNLAIRVIVVKSGPEDTGKWITHTRNVYEDYRKYFNEPPPRLKGVRIQSNTQYTKDTAEGFVRNIVFSRSLQALQ